MPCSVKIIITLLFIGVISFAGKKQLEKFTIKKGRGFLNTSYVEFAVGEKVWVYIQKEKGWLEGKIVRGPHNYSVQVRIPGRGDLWIHESNIDKRED